MANEFKIKNSLIINSSGSVNALDIQGSQGQLFSVTDSLSGSLFSVSDISGLPIIEVLSDDTVKMGTFANEALIVTGSRTGMGLSNPAAKLHVSGTANSALLEVDSVSSQNILFISGSGNVGIGTNNPAYKLDVIGNGRFRGLGATSATTAFLVQNSTPAELFKILDDGTWTSNGGGYIAGNLVCSTIYPKQNTDLTLTATWAESTQVLIETITNKGQVLIIRPGSNLTISSGDHSTTKVTHTFAPTSGTGRVNAIELLQTINQTGGANGITRGLYVNPTLTSAANWRSVEWTNNTGWGLFGRGVAPNFLSGSLTIADNLSVTGSGRFTNGIIVSGSTTTIGDLIVTGSVTSTTGFTGSYKGDISPQSTINGNPVIDMYTAIAFSVAL